MSTHEIAAHLLTASINLCKLETLQNEEYGPSLAHHVVQSYYYRSAHVQHSELVEVDSLTTMKKLIIHHLELELIFLPLVTGYQRLDLSQSRIALQSHSRTRSHSFYWR